MNPSEKSSTNIEKSSIDKAVEWEVDSGLLSVTELQLTSILNK